MTGNVRCPRFRPPRWLGSPGGRLRAPCSVPTLVLRLGTAPFSAAPVADRRYERPADNVYEHADCFSIPVPLCATIVNRTGRRRAQAAAQSGWVLRAAELSPWTAGTETGQRSDSRDSGRTVAGQRRAAAAIASSGADNASPVDLSARPRSAGRTSRKLHPAALTASPLFVLLLVVAGGRLRACSSGGAFDRQTPGAASTGAPPISSPVT